MSMIALILVLSSMMWFVIDNLKEKIWANKPYSSYITIAVSALLSFALTFGYSLDIVFALGLAESVTVIGEIITALAMMSGSAVVSEIIERFRLW